MHYGKKTAFGGLSLTAEDHREEAEGLVRVLAGWLDGFENSTGAMKATYGTSALVTFGQLLQAEKEANVPPMSISLQSSKRIVKVIEYLSRAR